MNKNPNEDAATGTAAIRAFAEQFGDINDPINRIILEEILKELFGIEEDNGQNKAI